MKHSNSMRLPAQRDQRGQSAVEIALLLPVLLLLIWGIMGQASLVLLSIFYLRNGRMAWSKFPEQPAEPALNTGSV